MAICYGLAGLYAVLGLALSQVRTRYAVVIYILMVAISALVVWQKGYLRMQGLRGVVPPKEKGSVKFEA